jgi:NAD(P)H-quinone oxidoreductase subunit 5
MGNDVEIPQMVIIQLGHIVHLNRTKQSNLYIFIYVVSAPIVCGNPDEGRHTLVFASFLPVLTIASLVAAGLVGFWKAQRMSRGHEQAVKALALVGLASALGSVAVVVLYGDMRATVPLFGPMGFELLIDGVSVTMLSLVAFLAWVILAYAISYLRAEPRQGEFVGYLALTLASVTALVQSANLVQLGIFWIATSILLHRLLLFYGDRPAARRAQRKKFVIARFGDVALISAIVLTYLEFGSVDIPNIAQAVQAPGFDGAIGWIVGLIGIAAIMKSAQFPTHGWIIEVMETPTPVSALLHAGIVNAGGFLLIRLSDLVVAAPDVMIAIELVGLVTAIFASAVMITQPAVKTRLAWSTISQMGFMILQCGLGLFALALLHIVAHSLYKAYAFLSSGGTIEKIHGMRKFGRQKPVGLATLAGSFGLALVLSIGGAALFGTDLDPALIAVSVVVIFAAQQFLLSTSREDAIARNWLIGGVTSLAVCGAYFGFHTLAHHAGAAGFPVWQGSVAVIWTVSVVVVAAFALLGVMQTYVLSVAQPARWFARFYVHLSNGFYVNATIDRLFGTWRMPTTPAKFSGEKS